MRSETSTVQGRLRKLTKAEADTKAAKDAEIKAPQRLFDLVRYMRHELHASDLITDEEYAEICSWGSESARRLEDYDSIREQLKSKDAEIAELKASRDELLEALKNVSDEAYNYIGYGWDRGNESVILAGYICVAHLAIKKAELKKELGK